MKDRQIVYNHEIPLTDLGAGVSRKILSYDEQMMIVEVHFEKNSIGSTHVHPHQQLTYVQSGRFRFTIDEQPFEVSQGDSLLFPPNIPHGMVCLESGVLLDIFHPMREEFI